MIDCSECVSYPCASCWRVRKTQRRAPMAVDDHYAAKMRAGRTPFFQARTGRGQWGTGPERRAAAIRSAEGRRG